MTKLYDQTREEKTKSHHFQLRIDKRSIYGDNSTYMFLKIAECKGQIET